MLKITWHVYINHNPQNVNIDFRWQVVTLTKHLTNKLHSTEPELRKLLLPHLFKELTTSVAIKCSLPRPQKQLLARFVDQINPDHIFVTAPPCSVRGPAFLFTFWN